VKALDTNILVRFLTKDNQQQAALVYKLFTKAETQQKVLFVPLLVVLETIWVLQSIYEISDKEILSAMSELLLMPILEFEAQPAIQYFITSAKETRLDLADILIAQSARLSGCERVITFDRRATRFEYFEILN